MTVQPGLCRTWPKTPKTGSLTTRLKSVSAPLAGIVMNKFNSRFVIIAGGLLSGVGLAASAFVESMDTVIVSAGAIVGKSFVGPTEL